VPPKPCEHQPESDLSRLEGAPTNAQSEFIIGFIAGAPSRNDKQPADLSRQQSIPIKADLSPVSRSPFQGR